MRNTPYRYVVDLVSFMRYLVMISRLLQAALQKLSLRGAHANGHFQIMMECHASQNVPTWNKKPLDVMVKKYLRNVLHKTEL